MDAALSAVLIAAIGPSGLLGGYAAFRKLREDKKDAEATAAAATGATFIAGGTNLLLWMPLGLQGISELLDM